MTKKSILAALSIVFLALEIASAQQRAGFIPHKVKWFEDLQSISAKYGIPSDVIIRVNSLKEPKVYTRSTIWIPVSEQYWNRVVTDSPETADVPIPEEVTEHSRAQADNNADNTGEEYAAETDRSRIDATQEQYIAQPTSSVSCTVLLPFSGTNRNQVDRSLDFYGGVLIAARKLSQEGINVKVDAVDFALRTDTPDWMDNDFILGPIRKEDLTEVLSELPSDKTVVSPLDQRAESLAVEHPNLVQMPSGAPAQWDSLIEWIKDEYTDAQLDTAHLNYILVGSNLDDATLQSASQKLDSAGISYTKCICGVQGDVSGWEQAYSQFKLNKVIIATGNEAVLNNAIRNMSVAASLGNVTVFCNSKIRSYETIPLEDIHHARVHAVCPYYIDYNDSLTMEFIRSYREFFNDEPSQYAFQGYDLAYFLLKTRSKYGPAWKALISDEDRVDLLQSSISLSKNDNGALCNTAVRRVLYERDFSLILQ